MARCLLNPAKASCLLSLKSSSIGWYLQEDGWIPQWRLIFPFPCKEGGRHTRAGCWYRLVALIPQTVTICSNLGLGLKSISRPTVGDRSLSRKTRWLKRKSLNLLLQRKRISEAYKGKMWSASSFVASFSCSPHRSSRGLQNLRFHEIWPSLIIRLKYERCK